MPSTNCLGKYLRIMPEQSDITDLKKGSDYSFIALADYIPLH